MDESKRQIVYGVWQVIATQGLAAVSIRSVATAAGVSAGRVQHHFGTKQALVRASAEHLVQSAAEANPEATGDPADPATLETLLLHSLGPASESRTGTSIYYAYVAASASDPWIANLLANAKQGVVADVERCLLVRNPRLADPSGAARRLVLLADGATQAVFLQAMDVDQARQLVLAALAEAVV